MTSQFRYVPCLLEWDKHQQCYDRTPSNRRISRLQGQSKSSSQRHRRWRILSVFDFTWWVGFNSSSFVSSLHFILHHIEFFLWFYLVSMIYHSRFVLQQFLKFWYVKKQLWTLQSKVFINYFDVVNSCNINLINRKMYDAICCNVTSKSSKTYYIQNKISAVKGAGMSCLHC